jgi:hypothetical protein
MDEDNANGMDGARTRVSSFGIDSFGLNADGKQRTLFGGKRTCIVLFQLWLWFFRCVFYQHQTSRSCDLF